MIRVNLIPYREEMRKIQARRQIIAAAAVFVALVLAVVLFHTYMTMSVSALEKQVASSRADLERLKKITGDIEKYRQDKELVEKKLEVINSLEKNRDEGYKLLVEFANTVPAGELWLTLLSKRDGTLGVEGIAKDSLTIADFMSRLEESPETESVDLVGIRHIEYAGKELKAFKLSGTLYRR